MSLSFRHETLSGLVCSERNKIFGDAGCWQMIIVSCAWTVALVSEVEYGE